MSDDALEIIGLEILVQASAAVEATLDDGPDLTPLKAILARGREDAAAAMRSLVDMDPLRTDEIRRLQHEARRYASLVEWLRRIVTEGREAAAQLKIIYHERAEEFRAQILDDPEDSQGAQD
jgi:hypothetical protein